MNHNPIVYITQNDVTAAIKRLDQGKTAVKPYFVIAYNCRLDGARNKSH
jgi:hypothetical protein